MIVSRETKKAGLILVLLFFYDILRKLSVLKKLLSYFNGSTNKKQLLNEKSVSVFKIS